ncbi:MAG: glycerate kinase type-2 family protein, partial [Anaerolineales bacterium]
ALLTLPHHPLTLKQLQQSTRLLLHSGATIEEINCIRKHLDEFKGGGLAQKAQPARVISLILSDVIGDDPATIASGITVPDTTTYDRALQILQFYQIENRVPQAVRSFLEDGKTGRIPETLKPTDSIFNNVCNYIIGSNAIACQSALEIFRQHGFSSYHLTSFLKGEAREVGKVMAAIARQLAIQPSQLKPIAIIAGGETTVTVRHPGVGGRNLELALGAVRDMQNLPNLLLLTFATDGEDGTSSAAGAVVNGDTLQRALELGLDPDEYLKKNDSHHFFKALDDLIFTAQTNTNVNDLVFIIAY